MGQRGTKIERTAPKGADLSAALPLFAFTELGEGLRERAELLERIKKLKPRSHRRVELEFRLREMTAREITLGLQLAARKAER